MQFQEVVTIEESVPVTTSYIVAEKLGIVHKNLVELIKDHQPRIEKHFGVLRFQTAKPSSPQGGRPEQFVSLTENQAHYILTLSRNTEESMEVKALFVKAFDEAKQKLALTEGRLAEAEALLAEVQLYIPEFFLRHTRCADLYHMAWNTRRWHETTDDFNTLIAEARKKRGQIPERTLERLEHLAEQMTADVQQVNTGLAEEKKTSRFISSLLSGYSDVGERLLAQRKQR